MPEERHEPSPHTTLALTATRPLAVRMFEKKYESGDYVITQGEQGDNFYIVDHGDCILPSLGLLIT